MPLFFYGILLFESEINCTEKETEAHKVLPLKWLFKIQHSKYCEYGKGNYFLDHFQLETIESIFKPSPVSRYH